MRVFVTGASGFIGSAVVQELINAGHTVLGLARSEEAAQSLIGAGAEVHKGSLEDLDSLKRGAADCDGIIHTAFIHDFSKFKDNCETDRNAIAAMASVLATSDRPMVITSGIGLLSPGRKATEEDMPNVTAAAIPRIASEEAADAAVASGARVMAVRLPPSVHGDGDHGFVPELIGIAREKGVSAYIGEGQNHWPAVHRLDAAHLFRLALEHGVAGARYHGIGDEGVPCREIAEAIGKKLGIPVVSISKEDAPAHFTWLAHFYSVDCPASSVLTHERLGWSATHKGLIDDLNNGTYFK